MLKLDLCCVFQAKLGDFAEVTSKLLYNISIDYAILDKRQKLSVTLSRPRLRSQTEASMSRPMNARGGGASCVQN